MVNGINLDSVINNLLSKIGETKEETKLTDKEKRELKQALGLDENANNSEFETAYINAMKKAGAEDETERTTVFNEIKTLIQSIVSKAPDKNAAIADITNLLNTAASAKDAQTALTTIINQLQIKSQKADDSNKSSEEKIHQLLEKFKSYDPVTKDDYTELMKLLSETGIPYELKSDTCGKKTVKFYDANGKSYEFSTNQFDVSEDKLIGDYIDTQLDAKSYDSIFTLESKCCDLGISPEDIQDCQGGKYQITYTDSEGKSHTATIAIKSEMPSYEGEAILNANIGITNPFNNQYFTMSIENGGFIINRENVSKEFAEWEKQNGPITTLEDLQKAMKAKAATPDVPPTGNTDPAKKAKIEEAIEKFIHGSSDSTDFDKLIKELNGKLIYSNYAKDGVYKFDFEIDGVKYHIENISKDKVKNDKDNDIFGFMKKDFDGVSKNDIEKYFDVAAWQGDNKETGAMGYVLKGEWVEKLGNSIDGMTPSQIINAIKNYNAGSPKTEDPATDNPKTEDPAIDNPKTDESKDVVINNIYELIDEFIKGNVTGAEFSDKLMNKLKGKVASSNYGADGTYDFTVTVGNKSFKISGIKVDAANNGTANDNVAALADDLKAQGLSEQQIKDYFTPVAWEGDKVIGYILKDEAKTKLGLSSEDIKAGISAEEIASAIKNTREVKENEIKDALIALDRGSIIELENLAKISGVKITVIKDSTKSGKYEVQIQYNGKIYPDLKSQAKYIGSEQFSKIEKSDKLKNSITDSVIVENVDDLIRGFTSGSMSGEQFTNALTRLNGGDASKNKTTYKEGDYYDFPFECQGKKYQISGINKEKARNGIANDIVAFKDSDLDNLSVDIKAYFDVVASSIEDIKDENGKITGTKTTPMYYILKSDMLETLGLDENATADEIIAAIKKEAEKEAEKLPDFENSIEEAMKMNLDKDDPNYGKIHVELKDGKFIVTVDGIHAAKEITQDKDGYNMMFYNVYFNDSKDNLDKGMQDILNSLDSNEKKKEVYDLLCDLQDPENLTSNISNDSNILKQLKSKGYTVTITSGNKQYTISVKNSENKEYKVNLKLNSEQIEDLEDYGFIDNKEFKNLKDAIKKLDTYKTTTKNVRDPKSKIETLIGDNSSIKEALKTELQKEPYNKTDEEFEALYTQITEGFADEVAKLYNDENANDNGKWDIKHADIFDKLLDKLNEELNKTQIDDRLELRSKRDKVFNAVKDNPAVDGEFSEGDSTSAVKDFLNSMKEAIITAAKTQNIDVSDKFDTALANYIKSLGTKFDEDTSYESVLKAFIGELLKTKDSSETVPASQIIDFSSISGYNDDKKVESSNFVTGDVNAVVTEKIKSYISDSIKTQIKDYLEKEFGYSISTDELDDIISNIIDKVVKSDKITKNNTSYSFKTKEVLKQFAEELKDYVANNNLSNKAWSYADITNAGINTSYLNNEKYFKKEGSDYKLNITELDKEFADYVKEHGSITTPEKLQEALRKEIKFDTINEYNASVLMALNSDRNTKVSLQFKINSDGKIIFVNKDGDVFAQTTDTAVNGIFGSGGRLENNLINTTYQKQLDVLFGNDNTAKKNLYNLALKMTLSDESVNLYDSVRAESIMTKVNENFLKLIQNAANDKNMADYIKDYHKTGLLKGRTTDDVGKLVGYTYGSTNGGDDWICIDDIAPYSFAYTNNDKKYTSSDIIHINSGVDDDDDYINKAIDTLLSKYIQEYGTYLSSDDIVKLFASAEKEAIQKLLAGIQSDDSNIYRNIYGYGNSGNRDTYYKGFTTVQQVIIQIMFEMENQINKAILVDGVKPPKQSTETRAPETGVNGANGGSPADSNSGKDNDKYNISNAGSFLYNNAEIIAICPDTTKRGNIMNVVMTTLFGSTPSKTYTAKELISEFKKQLAANT